MKITVEHIPDGENEVVLRCTHLDEEMLSVLAMLRSGLQKLCVWDDSGTILLIAPSEIVYCETVDERTFIYTQNAMYQTALALSELSERYSDAGFLRSSKSAVINLNHITHLKSLGGSRIEAIVTTGEKIIISRHYAPLLREQLGI